MAIGTDFEVQADGDIRHVANTNTYTVLELHRWLQGLADDAAASGDDIVDISRSTPSERSTDNIITLNAPYNIDDDAAKYFYDGSITQKGGDEMYSGLVVVGSLASTTTLQVVQNNALYDGDSPFWGTGLNAVPASNILSRMLIKTRTSGADRDGKRIRVYARELGDTYAEFSVTMGLGNSVAAIFTNDDLNNTSTAGTISGWSDITNSEGYQGIDLGGGDGTKYYYSQWDRGSRTINELYERTKWLTRRGTSSTVYGMDGELFRGITHQWDYDGETGGGSWTQNEVLSWGSGTTAGTAALLAIKDLGTTGTVWVQLLTGVVPTDPMTITGGSSLKTMDINGSVTARSVPQHILGVSTGSAIIGAYGVGVQASDLSKNDLIFDLNNDPQSPPNTVTFSVTSLIGGEDRVLVGPAWGNDFDYDQLALATTLNGAGTTSVVVSGTIPSDTPASGTIRIRLDTGVFRRVWYTSYTGNTFTITSTDFTDPNDSTAPAPIFISYIDDLTYGWATSLSFAAIYDADRALYVRVRDGGATPIKTFETPATFGNANSSVAAIRTSDA